MGGREVGTVGAVDVTEHFGLARFFAKRDRGPVPYEDKFQVGVLGLMKAAETFDPSLGFQFSTYARKHVYRAIAQAWPNTERSIRIPYHKYDRLRRAGKLPDIPVSLDSEVQLSGGDGLEGECTLYAVVPSDLASQEDSLGEAEREDVVRRCLDALEEPRKPGMRLTKSHSLTWRELLRLRFEEDMNLADIGRKYGLSRERVRQIETEALAAMRKQLEAAL